MDFKYKTQNLAYRFYVLMLIFFALQVLFGVLLALIQLDPNLLKGTLNFNVARAYHLNLAVVWIVTGFIATILFVGPLLGQKEIRPMWIVHFLFYALIVTVIWTACTLPLAQKGIAGYVDGYNWPWLQQGKEFLEAGRVTDLLLLVGFGLFAYLTLYLFPKKLKDWNELHWGLAIGVGGLALVWIFTLISAENLDTQEYFRWYVVHYWVEAVWEIIHITLIGFLLAKFFGAGLREVGFAVFWGVSLVILSGLIGNSHHYFWIGTPAFWQFWGSLFSALEPLPLIFCIWHVYLDEKHGVTPIENRVAFYFIFGSALFESVGAGILGFTMTMAYANIWEHGTWLTAAHGHLALFGAFGLLVIGAGYEAVRRHFGIYRFKGYLGRLSFWLLVAGLLGLMGSFANGGAKEIFVYRVLGLDWWGHHVRPAMAQGRVLLGGSAFIFLTGSIILIYDMLTMKDRAMDEHEYKTYMARLSARSKVSWWGKRMQANEFGTWLAGMWFFGLIVTAGVFSFNLHSVRIGDPTVPFLVLQIGYVGLVLTTIVFATRFLTAFETRQNMLQVLLDTNNNDLRTVDLRNNLEDEDREILKVFNTLKYGEALMMISNKSMAEKHLELHHILGVGFAWENLKDGPDEWRAKVGKLN